MSVEPIDIREEYLKGLNEYFHKKVREAEEEYIKKLMEEL